MFTVLPFRISGVVAACITASVLWAGAPSTFAAPPDAKSQIAWRVASSDAEVDRAFALAKQSGKPVFLYWGAVWCPPCNQVKATLFNRPDFIERSRAFVPVYVDGDKPGAQKVAARFKVSGYPTMILFKSDGSEVTRLPGEVDPQRYLITLSSALEAEVSVKELVDRAVARQALTPEQWRLLAFYSWETDHQQLLKAGDVAQRLTELAAAVPADLPLIKARLAFKAVFARADAGTDKVDPAILRNDRRVVDSVLAVESGADELADLIVYYAEPVIQYCAPAGDERRALSRRWETALDRLLGRGAISPAVRVDALDTRVTLWKFQEGGGANAAHREEVRREVAEIVSRTSDRYERQAVIPSAAHVLTSAGLIDESDRLLKSELPRAVAPYYHMLGLAGNAKARGDAVGALKWYEQAWRKAEGPATQLQWGANYVANIIDLTPADVKRVTNSASAVISSLEPKSETFLRETSGRCRRWRKSSLFGRPATRFERRPYRNCGISSFVPAPRCRPKLQAARTAMRFFHLHRQRLNFLQHVAR